MNSYHKSFIYKFSITLFIVCICLFASNKLWISFYPANVFLSIGGSGKVNIEAQLNKKNNTEFKKVKSEDITTKLDKLTNVKLEIKRAKYPKKLKLKFSISSSDKLSDIYINKISVSKQEIKINDVNDFIAKNAEFHIKDNRLIISPEHHNFEIICLQKLNIKPEFKINYCFFIIIFNIAIIFIYRFVSYITDFKIRKNSSLIEVMFLVIFFTILFVPMAKIDTSKNLVLENRIMAKYPAFAVNQKINKHFFKEFSNWFNDRFFGRRNLIEFHAKTECQINKNYCGNELATFYKNKNIIYLNRSWGLAPLTTDKESILKTYAKNINNLYDFCRSNNIKLYILIAPRQVDFFDNSELYDNRKNRPDPADEVISYLKNNTSVNIIYPKEIMLKENKTEPMFFKTDNHWTQKGAFIGYLELMKAIKKDFPKVSVINENSLEKYYDNKVYNQYGDGVSQIGLPKNTAEKMMDTLYPYYKNPKDYLLVSGNYSSKINFQKEDGDIEFFNKNALNKKVIVIGNSFSQSLIDFLPYSFKTTIRLADHIGKRNLNFNVYKELLLNEKPDILILCFQTTYMFNLLNLYPNEYSKFGDEQ